MFQESFPLTDKTCFLYGNPQPSHLLIQPVGAQDLSGGLEKEVACLKKMAGEDFLLAAFEIKNWNQQKQRARNGQKQGCEDRPVP